MYSIDNIEVFILVAIVLFLIIHITEKNNNHNNQYDTWINYREEPLGNIKTAPFKLSNYYRRDRYKKPYNYPVCEMTDYPIRHCRYLP